MQLHEKKREFIRLIAYLCLKFGKTFLLKQAKIIHTKEEMNFCKVILKKVWNFADFRQENKSYKLKLYYVIFIFIYFITISLSIY